MPKRSVFGLQENLVCLLCYVLFFFSGIAILVLERENKLVRFHAMQSILWFSALFLVMVVVNLVVGWIPIIGGIPGIFLNLLCVVSWLFLMVTALLGKGYKIPIIGDVAKAQVD